MEVILSFKKLYGMFIAAYWQHVVKFLIGLYQRIVHILGPDRRFRAISDETDLVTWKILDPKHVGTQIFLIYVHYSGALCGPKF